MANSPWALFEEGCYHAVIESIAIPGKNSEETAALISSFAFLGRMQEAFDIWESRGTRLNDLDACRSRFTLAVTATRISQFKLARKLLLENQTHRGSADPFVAQGIAFYYYYRGRFQKAGRFARRALRGSIETGDEFLRLLATDLAAHSQIQQGCLSVGLRLFTQGAELARDRGASSIVEAMGVSKLMAESEAGFRPQSILRELMQRRDSLRAQDFYLHTNLNFEIARQLTLRGRFLEARKLLDSESQTIYSYKNRRHEMTLQLRLAEIAFQQGDAPACGHFLRSAGRCLNRVADQAYEIRVLGLDRKLHEKLLHREFPEASMQRLLALSTSHPSRINQQILSRTGALIEDFEQPDVDSLHSLLLEVRNSRATGLSEIARRGYWGLWANALGLKPGTSSFIQRSEEPSLILVSREVVRPLEEGLGPRAIRLLQRLHQGHASKEELIRQLWGYEYDPLLHDPLIYSALSGLRKALGPDASWIETTENGWAMAPSIEWHEEITKVPRDKKLGEIFTQAAAAAVVVPEKLPDFQDLPADLSLRQFKAVGLLAQRESWDVRSYCDFFQISPMTAFRDLDALREKGYLRRHGKGRASCYLPTGRII